MKRRWKLTRLDLETSGRRCVQILTDTMSSGDLSFRSESGRMVYVKRLTIYKGGRMGIVGGEEQGSDDG